jgi:hypothetical protein
MNDNELYYASIVCLFWFGRKVIYQIYKNRFVELNILRGALNSCGGHTRLKPLVRHYTPAN